MWTNNTRKIIIGVCSTFPNQEPRVPRLSYITRSHAQSKASTEPDVGDQPNFLILLFVYFSDVFSNI